MKRQSEKSRKASFEANKQARMERAKRTYFKTETDAEAHLTQNGYQNTGDNERYPWRKTSGTVRAAAEIRYNSQGFFIEVGTC